MPEERRKTIWSKLESNPGPLASQVTTLTARPCLLRDFNTVVARSVDSKLTNLGSNPLEWRVSEVSMSYLVQAERVIGRDFAILIFYRLRSG